MPRNGWTRSLTHLRSEFRRHLGVEAPPKPPWTRFDRSWLLAVTALGLAGLPKLFLACDRPTQSGARRSNSERPNATNSAMTPKSTTGETEASANRDSEGGSLALHDGPWKGTNLEIPPGTFKESMLITINMVSSSKKRLVRKLSASPRVNVEPNRLEFARPVVVTLPVTTPAYVWQRSGAFRKRSGLNVTAWIAARLEEEQG